MAGKWNPGCCVFTAPVFLPDRSILFKGSQYSIFPVVLLFKFLQILLLYIIFIFYFCLAVLL